MIYGTQEFADKMKAVIKDGYRHPLYEQTVEHAKAMGVHIYGDKPIYLLDRARPREDDEVKTYRIENYEPTTKAGADKAIDIVGKIFNPMLYSIVFKEHTPDSELLEKYTLEYFPNYNSIVSFNKEVTLRKMLADPNGLMAVKPSEVPQMDTQRIEPVCVIYGSSAIWNYDRDHYIIFLRDEEVANRQKNYYFEYYDKTQYFEFYCWYDDTTKSINFVEVTNPYNHNFNEIPTWFLRGKSKSIDNGMIVYESFFSSALPHWNLAIIHESDLMGAILNHMHPISYEVVDECNYQFKYEGLSYPCRGGHITYPGPNGTKSEMKCPHCTGTGYKAVQSGYGKYQFSKQKLEDGNMPAGLMPVGYINVPTEATQMLIDRCKEMNRQAMWAINMDVEDKVGESNSGVAKAIDRSAQWDTLYTIGTVVFDVHLPNQYYFINKYKFGIEAMSMNKKEDKNLPSINKPTNFDILSTAERINNFAVAQKSGMDKNYLRIKSIEIANSDLSTNPDARKYLVAMLNLDPLYGFTQDEISLGVTNGVIRKVDWSVHENLKTFIDRAIKENPAFLELPKEDQIVILEKYGNELVAANKPKVDPNILQIDKEVEVAA